MKPVARIKELETVLVLMIALGVLYWRLRQPAWLLAALLLGILALLIPKAATAIHWLWMKLSEGIGFVMNKVILSGIFILLVIPLGWLLRRKRNQSIQLKPGGDSYFISRNHQYTGKDLEHPW